MTKFNNLALLRSSNRAIRSAYGMAKGGKPEKDKRSYMDMDDEISRQHITKKQATELALGFVPGVGVANAFGKGIAVNDSGIPTGVEDVPSTLELARTGHPWLAGLSAVGAIPDAAYLAQSAKMLSPSARALAKAGLTGNYAGVPAERGMVKLINDLPMDEASKIKLSAAEEYNAASYLDGTGPDYKINDLLDADDNFVPGKSRALYKALEKMGVRVDGYPGGGTSDYFTINVLDKNNPLDEFGESNFNEFKIRVADHSNTTNKYNQPDINVSPHNNSLNEAIDKLYDLVKSNQVKMVRND